MHGCTKGYSRSNYEIFPERTKSKEIVNTKEVNAVQYMKRCLTTVVLTKRVSRVEDSTSSMENERKILNTRVTGHDYF